MRKFISLLSYTISKVLQILFICLYLFVGSMGAIIMAGLIYGGIKETIKFYNGKTN